jgi:hypothetical protein
LACVEKPAGPLEPVDGSIAGFGGEEEAELPSRSSSWSSSPIFIAFGLVCRLPPILRPRRHCVVWSGRGVGGLTRLCSGSGAIQWDYHGVNVITAFGWSELCAAGPVIFF